MIRVVSRSNAVNFQELILYMFGLFICMNLVYVRFFDFEKAIKETRADLHKDYFNLVIGIVAVLLFLELSIIEFFIPV